MRPRFIRARFGDKSQSVAAAAIPIGVNLLITPVLARELGLAQYGLWASIITALSVLQLVDFGFFGSLYRFMTVSESNEGRGGADRYLISAVYFYILVALGLAIVALAVGPTVLHYLSERTSEVPRVLFLLLLLAAINPISGAATFHLQAQGWFRGTLIVTAISQSSFMALVVYASFAGSLTIAELLIYYIIARLVPAAVALSRLSSRGRRTGTPMSPSELKDFFAFGKGVWVTNLSMAVTLQLPLLVIGSQLSPSDLGIYGMAAVVSMQLRNIPLFALPPVILDLTGDPVTIARRGRQIDRRWLKTLSLYAAVCVLGIPIGVPVLYGPEYADGVVPCLLLYFGYLIQLSGAIATNTMRQLGYVGVESLASGIAALAYAGMLTWAVGQFGLNGPGMVLMPAMALGAAIVRWYARSLTGRLVERAQP